jgi:hypothetical protein
MPGSNEDQPLFELVADLNLDGPDGLPNQHVWDADSSIAARESPARSRHALGIDSYSSFHAAGKSGPGITSPRIAIAAIILSRLAASLIPSMMPKRTADTIPSAMPATWPPGITDTIATSLLTIVSAAGRARFSNLLQEGAGGGGADTPQSAASDVASRFAVMFSRVQLVGIPSG